MKQGTQRPARRDTEKKSEKSRDKKPKENVISERGKKQRESEVGKLSAVKQKSVEMK